MTSKVRLDFSPNEWLTDHGREVESDPTYESDPAHGAPGETLVPAGVAGLFKNGWPVANAVVDNAGLLVAYERMDDTQTGSVQVAIDEAASAAMCRRSTEAFQTVLAGGGAGLRTRGLRGASPGEGGLTLVVDRKITGGVGVSGANADQDGVVARARADALK